jgi:O-antigen/teichoic acid export membrane protein
MPYSLKSVFKGGSIYTIGQLLTKASAFFLIPLYTRFLTPEDFGIIGYAHVVLQFAGTFFVFGLRGSQTRFFYQYKDDSLNVGSFIFTINLFLLVILSCFFVIYFFSKEIILNYLHTNNFILAPYLDIVILIIFFQVFNQMIVAYYLAAKNYKKCAFLQFIQFILTTLIIILFVVVLNQGAYGQIKGILWGNIVFFFIFCWDYIRKFSFKFSFSHLTTALIFGIPILFHLLMGSIHASIDRVILERYVSLGELGIYTLGYQIGMVLSVIVGSINRAWQPNYFEFMSSSMDIEQKKFENRRMLALWVIGIGSICLVGMMWAKEFLILLTPENFHVAAGVVPIILFGYFFQGLYFFAVSPLFQFKKTKFLPFLTAVSALLNIILNFMFIPKYGIYGAAYATVLSFAFQSAFVYFVSKKLFYPEYEFFPIIVAILSFTFVLIFINFLEVNFLAEMIKVIFLMLFIAGMTYLYKDYSYNILTKIRKRCLPGA